MNPIGPAALAAIIVTVALPATAAAPAPRTGSPAAGITPYGRPDDRWVLQFDDEFNGDALDPGRWSNGFGWGDTADYSSERCAPANTVVGEGYLIERLDNDGDGTKPYTSGCVNTKHTFSQTYGFWEARMKVPRGDGFVSAFWLKPDSEAWPPETDIEEVLGNDPRIQRMAVFWRDGADNVRASQARGNGPDLSDGFHVFGLEWNPDETIWYVDGRERWRTSAGSRAMADKGSFYMMINAHIGTDFGGHPDRSAVWPAYQLVDYVRVWRAGSAGERGARR